LPRNPAQFALAECREEIGAHADILAIPIGQLLLDQPLPAKVERLA
jgi:hypothetical protein